MTTIVALSSGRPPAAIAIVRASGPEAFEAAAAIAGTLPRPRRAELRALRDASGALLDRALVLVFPGPASATGEDLVEFHCHGGRAVVAAVEAALVGQPGCRRALPGEFTRRALTNGRIDLTEAEGLADLLEAETETQRVLALAAAEGRISRQVGEWMHRVADLSAEVEARIDYAEDADIADDDEAIGRIARAAAAIGREIEAAASAPPVERWRDGVRIVIAGPPNAGKSTLLNLLAERDAAIVSPIAGTTRDVVEASVRRVGHAFVLTDTAGLTATDDAIEAIGVERAARHLRSADVLIWLGDAPPPRDDALWVHARADLPGRRAMPPGRDLAIRQDDLSSIEALWIEIARRAERLLPRDDALPLRERHRARCRAAAEALTMVSGDPLILAEALRHARRELAAIVGVDATESMLDALFTRFCLGK